MVTLIPQINKTDGIKDSFKLVVKERDWAGSLTKPFLPEKIIFLPIVKNTTALDEAMSLKHSIVIYLIFIF